MGVTSDVACSPARHHAHRLRPWRLELPAWRYAEAFAGDPWRFLLDSATAPGPRGRFSFVGGAPVCVLEVSRVAGRGPGQAARVRTWRPSTGWQSAEAEPWQALRAAWAEHAVPEAVITRRVPFVGGAVGWLGYEAGHFVERLPERAVNDLGLPELYFMFVDALLAHDAETDEAFVSSLGRGSTAAEAEEHAAAAEAALCARLAALEASPPPAWVGPAETRAPCVPRQHFDGAAYAALVERAREHIYAGDVFEVCTTHRLEVPYPHAPWSLYCELRRTNPAPFASFLETPRAAVVSASPERFLRLGPDRVAESRPIKGTRPRGATVAEDRALAEALSTSPKDRAENVMIVDLVRNDLGRVCALGSVHVPELMVLESYRTVHQLVSTVRGTLRPDRDAIDLIQACFPGGSMTGAPKVEAMKLIDRLEPVARGIYSGAIGYLDAAGTLDLNIVIRSAIVTGGRAYVGVGGAVVADSEPHAEYQETLDKARALLVALAGVDR